MGGRGAVREFSLDRVLVEPGDGAQPPGDGGACAARPSRSRAKVSMSARRTANGEMERVRHQAVNWRRSSAQASRVRLRYPARNPARANRSASVKAGLIVASAVDGAAVVIGYLPDELRPGKLGQQRAPAIKRKPTVSSALRPRQVTICWSRSPDRSPERCSRSPNVWVSMSARPAWRLARRRASSVHAGPAGRCASRHFPDDPERVIGCGRSFSGCVRHAGLHGRGRPGAPYPVWLSAGSWLGDR